MASGLIHRKPRGLTKARAVLSHSCKTATEIQTPFGFDGRWCLSGTPIQNGVEDLFSYFKFLRYAPYSDPRSFKILIKVCVETAESSLGGEHMIASYCL